MSDFPLLMSGLMVQAILEGRKTQIREVISSRNSTVLGRNVTSSSLLWTGLIWDKRVYRDKGPHILHPSTSEYLHVPFVNTQDGDEDQVFRVRSRKEVGDHLWVKETWNLIEVVVSPIPRPDKLVYRASPETYSAYPGIHWHRGMEMPRWASRLDLEITGVRVAHIQDITEADAIAEGFSAETPKDLWCWVFDFKIKENYHG